MIIIGGWKKSAREIAYLGINWCPNCKNYDHFAMYEIATKVNLYFVPVAKFKKKFIWACELCEAAWEVDEEKRGDLLRESATIPDRDYVTNLWNEIDQELSSAIGAARSPENSDSVDLLELIEGYRDEFLGRHESKQATYVIDKYMEFLADPDKPE